MKLFKEYDLIALLRHLEVNFQGESGVDGGKHFEMEKKINFCKRWTSSRVL